MGDWTTVSEWEGVGCNWAIRLQGLTVSLWRQVPREEWWALARDHEEATGNKWEAGTPLEDGWVPMLKGGRYNEPGSLVQWGMSNGGIIEREAVELIPHLRRGWLWHESVSIKQQIKEAVSKLRSIADKLDAAENTRRSYNFAARAIVKGMGGDLNAT